MNEFKVPETKSQPSNKKQIKIYISIGLTLIIVILSVFIYINRNNLFNNTMEIRYYSGCVEKFINGNITTSYCNVERMKIAEQERLNNQSQFTNNFNFSKINIDNFTN